MSRRVIVLVSVLATAGIACQKREPAPAPQPTPVAAPAPTPAPQPDPWKQTAPKKDPLAHPLFWAVEKDGKTTYFLGTMHVGVDAETRLPDYVWQKLDAAKTFAMEADLESQSIGDMKRTDGSSLHKDLGDAYWAKLVEAMGPGMAKA